MKVINNTPNKKVLKHIYIALLFSTIIITPVMADKKGTKVGLYCATQKHIRSSWSTVRCNEPGVSCDSATNTCTITKEGVTYNGNTSDGKLIIKDKKRLKPIEKLTPNTVRKPKKPSPKTSPALKRQTVPRAEQVEKKQLGVTKVLTPTAEKRVWELRTNKKM